MQIQMAVLFFFSGAHKLRGDDWWTGAVRAPVTSHGHP
jgi:hypothetical protein